MQKIVVLEGINGTGKSTVIKALLESYPNAIATSHPGSTEIGKELRKLLKFGDFKLTGAQELALFATDAIGFYNQFIAGFDQTNDQILICDRLNITSAVYQRAKGVTLTEIDAMYNLLVACGWRKQIDKLIVFNAPFDVIQARIKKPTLVDQDKVQGDKKDRFESAGDDYLRRVHGYYSEFRTDVAYRYMLNKFVNTKDIREVMVNRDPKDVIADVKSIIDE
ncbi:Thymidylate kinase [Azospirillaceae bacterium]